MRAAADAGADAPRDHRPRPDRGGAAGPRRGARRACSIIIGEEVKTADGDLIALFLERAVAPGRSARDTIDEVRAQGGLVGIPHPFDHFRGSMLKDPRLEALAPLVDWVESHNARVVGGSGNEQAAAFALEMGLPGIAVSDAHSVVEVGVAYTMLDGNPSTPEGMLAALTNVALVPGRASYIVRTLTPMAKLVNRARGNRRVSPTARPADTGASS